MSEFTFDEEENSEGKAVLFKFNLVQVISSGMQYYSNM